MRLNDLLRWRFFFAAVAQVFSKRCPPQFSLKLNRNKRDGDVADSGVKMRRVRQRIFHKHSSCIISWLSGLGFWLHLLFSVLIRIGNTVPLMPLWLLLSLPLFGSSSLECGAHCWCCRWFEADVVIAMGELGDNACVECLVMKCVGAEHLQWRVPFHYL